jgi:hypothetical protein
MKDLQSHTVEIDGSQMEFLNQMVAEFGLPDVGKAIRCLVNYAREEPGQRDAIFQEIRCLEC